MGDASVEDNRLRESGHRRTMDNPRALWRVGRSALRRRGVHLGTRDRHSSMSVMVTGRHAGERGNKSRAKEEPAHIVVNAREGSKVTCNDSLWRPNANYVAIFCSFEARKTTAFAA